MIQRIVVFLGPARVRLLLALLGVTGLISLILNAFGGQGWVLPVQSALFLAFIVGSAVLFIGRLPEEERSRWGAIIVPSVIALALALFVLPQYGVLLVGVAVGWLLAAPFLTRPRMNMAYKDAIRHLRKNNYAESVKAMDELIKEEPDVAQHYKFRAEVLRLWGRLDRATQDYQKMTKLAPDSPVGFNGLAEVHLQRENFTAAVEAAEKAHSLAPDDWVALYNLGMIEDRLKRSEDVVNHLQAALALKVKDPRHLILIHLYLARAYARSGDKAAAGEQIKALQKYGGGLEEWEVILKDPQAETLRAVIGEDITAAQYLADNIWTVEKLAKS